MLVIHYITDSAAASGMLTAVTNRVGDALLIVCLPIMVIGSSSFIIWLLALAAMTKRAQVPFRSWLPAAIAAPTPVSALVHRSTLVTAGVYLLLRFRGGICTPISFCLMVVGFTTSLLASLCAVCEMDLKKIVALSTLSQLGVMVYTISLSFSHLAFFHLVTHALFKSLLFICVGMIILRSGHGQDVRGLGGSFYTMPLTGSLLVVSNLSLCGVPFLAGFYSKDLIIEASVSLSSTLWVILFFLQVCATCAYTVRLLVYSVMVRPLKRYAAHDERNVVWPAFVGLGGGRITSGFYLS